LDVGLEAFISIRSKLGHGSLVVCEGRATPRRADISEEVLKKLSLRAKVAGVANYVHFQDFQYEEMASAYRAVDLVWYPTSGNEAFGLVPLEAMACGRPVIASASGGMLETMVPNVTGLIVARGDAGALADAAIKLIIDVDLREQIIFEGLRHVERFSLATYCDQLESVYRSLVTQ